MCISCSLFYILCHPLPHGPISNTTRSVPIAHYCLPHRLCHEKRSKGSLFGKQKQACVLITGYEYCDLLG